jgi:hypothetical protein
MIKAQAGQFDGGEHIAEHGAGIYSDFAVSDKGGKEGGMAEDDDGVERRIVFEEDVADGEQPVEGAVPVIFAGHDAGVGKEVAVFLMEWQE